MAGGGGWQVVVLLLVCSAVRVRSDGSDHKYKVGDPVPLYANKVGPFHNPSETYRYFDLPFCSPVDVKDKSEALGEVLNGDRLVSAPYKLDFLVDKESEVICKKKLSQKEVAEFRRAVAKDYYFQMYYDDLPIWGFLGKVDKEGKADPSEYKYYLFQHLHFEIFYNKDRVIEINARTDPSALVDLTDDKEVDVDFMYSAKWKETSVPFEKRMEKYSHSSSLPRHLEIHWFSIINSCVTVLLLTGFLATILMRVLKNDFVKYAHDEETADDQEETGWKYIHGDVFRFPKYKSLFAAALGSGTQLFTLATFIFMLALVGVFYPYNRGALFTALVVIYALTSGIAGYTAASFYCQLEGTNWVRNLLLTGGLFCGPLFLTFCFLNTVAIAYHATAALPFGTIVVIFLIWALVTSPLLVLGGIAGKNSKAEFQAPCRTTKYPREIPPLPWYRGTLPQMAMAGFLPFSAIYIELYYIFASVWGHRIYTIYSILFIVFIILLIVTAFITVALTYFQLAAEDHEWWWSETYRYFDLPFCSPGNVKDKSEALGEVLNGDRLVSAPYKLDFLVDKESEVICKKQLSKKEVAEFRSAVSKDYYFQMYYDDLPIWGFLGKVDKEGKTDPSQYKYYLFKHLHFEIFYNKDRVIEINARTDPSALVDLTDDKEVDVEFMYSVKWKETSIPFEKRMEKYSHSSSLPRHLEIHWFSIINSCVTVLLLTGFLATILMRVLKNDFVKYAHDEEAADDQEETGWKYIHGDVFRFPKYKSLFAAALGSGTQLFTLATFIFLLALVGVFYPYNRGALFTALVVIYALTSGIAGYTAACFYCQLEGTNWAEFQAPCRTTKYPREIPPLPWYRGALPQMAMAGFLPFSAIYIELYYIFASVWGHRIYTIYSILFIVFIILLIVTAFITVALTYFQLAAEDHEWWWRSFLCGGSTGLFIYGYCLYYYYARSDMSGFMQTSFFFGYMACVCYAFFLMLGAVGFRAALFFVRHIYRSIKCE
ncbi:endomembrane protein 70 protein family [Striga asiatica]|uniref:Transmembrane 9 superfamily member n=1 Tax=Striga asiatica TaxID=4170 RepID=A0A5A7P0H2_STRAF|nr:endomembrane protein 70 protein family [Striga asiatica]